MLCDPRIFSFLPVFALIHCRLTISNQCNHIHLELIFKNEIYSSLTTKGVREQAKRSVLKKHNDHPIIQLHESLHQDSPECAYNPPISQLYLFVKSCNKTFILSELQASALIPTLLECTHHHIYPY
jgi:hypothetical protein